MHGRGAAVKRQSYAGELPAPGELRYVRLYGEVREVVVQPFQERLVRELGGCISARDTAGAVYRNFLPRELKGSPRDFPASAEGNGK